MSFSPEGLNEQSMDQLSAAFSQALSKVTGKARPEEESHALLLHALGRPEEDSGTDRARILNAMRFTSGRKLLWRLISAQMRAGINSFTALKNIQRDRQKLGFPDGFDGVLTEWLSMLEQGQPHQEFFVRYVMPVDFEEGAWLSLNARLSSFENALLKASKH